MTNTAWDFLTPAEVRAIGEWSERTGCRFEDFVEMAVSAPDGTLDKINERLGTRADHLSARDVESLLKLARAT